MIAALSTRQSVFRVERINSMNIRKKKVVVWGVLFAIVLGTTAAFYWRADA